MRYVRVGSLGGCEERRWGLWEPTDHVVLRPALISINIALTSGDDKGSVTLLRTSERDVDFFVFSGSKVLPVKENASFKSHISQLCKHGYVHRVKLSSAWFVDHKVKVVLIWTSKNNAARRRKKTSA